LIFFLFAVPAKDKVSLASIDNILLENINPESYDLSYTCLLIPCLPTCHLQGDLAERLPQWMKQICTPHNWWLEFLTVDADYFQWGLRVDPSIQASQFMQVIRQKTSELILSSFENIRNEISADGFWAPGYLVVLGIRPHSKEMAKQYIRMIRRK
jgi:REP element-mobilizing transposase RayT